jgi:TonB-dependent SusC/RagA subfamily outer membrane receptor
MARRAFALAAVLLGVCLIIPRGIFAQEVNMEHRLAFGYGIMGQKVPASLSKRISVDLERVRLEDALNYVADLAGIRLNYSRHILPVDRRVTVKLTNAPVVEVLTALLDQTAAEFMVESEKGVLIVPSTLSGRMRQAPTVSKIRGKVVDAETGEPLMGANVFLKGTQVGAATDRNGVFLIPNAPLGTYVLVVSYIGYKREEKEIRVVQGQELRVDFELQPDIFQGEQVVVTGLASRREKSVAEVAVARVDAAELSERQMYTTVDQIFKSKIPGVQLHPASGNVGGGFRFFVRSGGGLNGNEQPLIYIDGVRVDDSRLQLIWNGGQGYSNLLSLVPAQIEKIEVLKGPAAAAMYGTNASNGVILITTKSGRIGEGKAKIRYRLHYGINTKPFRYDPKKYFNADLYNDHILRDGIVREHIVEVTGGTGNIGYFVSFEDKFEEGIVPKSFQDRKAVRANLTALPRKNLNLRFHSLFSTNDLSRPFSDDAVLSPHWGTIMVDTPWKWYDSLAIASTQEPGKNNRFLGGLQAVWTPLRGLEVSGNFGIDHSYHREDEFLPPEYRYWLGYGGRRLLTERYNKQYTYDFKVSYTYSPISDLHINSNIGMQLFEREDTWSGMQVRQFATSLISDVGSGSDIRGVWEGKYQERQAGLFMTHSLTYKDRYFATLSLRKDYASAVGQEAPSIYYPQASFAVRVDRLGVLPKLFTMMKLRAAYGESGQLPGPYDSKRLLWGAYGNAYGGPGAIPNYVGNPAIEPERIGELEVGFDLEVISRYYMEFTYYRQNARNSIVGKPNAPSTGFGGFQSPFNIGKVEGEGIEFMFRANPIRTRNYNLDLTFVWNWQDNKVIDLGGQGPIIANYRVNAIAEGLPKHEYYAVITTGAKFDENGVYIGDIESDGRVDLGSPIPKHTGSFTVNFRFLRNFNLYALADWGLKKKVFSIFRQFAARNGGYRPFFEMAAKLGLKDRWGWNSRLDFDQIQPLEPGTPEYIKLANEFARMNPFYRGNYIFDADYFVLREVSLSYDMTDMLENIPFLSNVFTDLSIGISAKNLVRISKYKDGDFEVNAPGSRSGAWSVDYGTVPPPKVYNFWISFGI